MDDKNLAPTGWSEDSLQKFAWPALAILMTTIVIALPLAPARAAWSKGKDGALQV